MSEDVPAEDVKTEQAEAEARVKELVPLFLDLFSTRPKRGPRITFGPKVGKAVAVEVVPAKTWEKVVTDEGTRMAQRIEPMVLKFAPEIVLAELQRYYRAMKQPFPADRLPVIDEHARLTDDERIILFTLVKTLTIKQAKEEASTSAGFYSDTLGKIFLLEGQVDAGTIAHEMAHAAAFGGWRDFIDLMRLRKMDDVRKLDEGMTTRIERLVVRAWFAKQSGATLIPLQRYDRSYTDRANDFVTAVGEEAAYQAYFAGEVDYDASQPPEDALRIGKARKKWKWPWR